MAFCYMEYLANVVMKAVVCKLHAVEHPSPLASLVFKGIFSRDKSAQKTSKYLLQLLQFVKLCVFQELRDMIAEINP